MSILIRFSSDSKISSAKIFANCVLPTPVCPRKINDPIGLSGSFSPARFLWIDLTTFLTASSCPISFVLIFSERDASLFFSLLTIFVTGILVIIETTSEISVSLTVTRFNLDSSCHLS